MGQVTRCPRFNGLKSIGFVQVFWENLIKGNDMIRQTRWPKELYGTPPRVGLIKNLDKFDADYFNFEETEVLYIFKT